MPLRDGEHKYSIFWFTGESDSYIKSSSTLSDKQMRKMREGKSRAVTGACSRCGAVICLLALMLITTGCFQSDQATQTNVRPRGFGPNAIWPLQQDGPTTPPSAHVIAAEDLPYGIESPGYTARFSDSGEPLNRYSRYSAASQARSIFSPKAYSIGRSSKYSGSTYSASALMNSPSTAAVFGKSFGTLFASLFKNGSAEADAMAEATGDESRNPFREARQRSDLKAADPSAKADSPSASTASPDPKPANSPSPIPVTPAPDSRVIFLGDFDGSGILKLMEASRVDDTSFSFSDAQRVFNLFINPSAVDHERSLALDDVNGDGRVDLVYTSRASVAGGVLLGDGSGNFRTIFDTFVTGYEPTVATVGPWFNGVRDIVTLDTRTGSVTVYRAGGHYRLLRTLSLRFLPDYIAHFVSLQDGLDLFMAAEGGNPQDLYNWQDDGTLEGTGTLPGNPSLFYTRDFLSQNVTNVLQVYQVGSYATVTLDNGHGLTFNVANMKMWPGVFLAIGDLMNNGTLDVAVAYLVSSTPAK